VVDDDTCNSCCNDPRFDHEHFLRCPRGKDSPRQFECTRLITADQVKVAFGNIPQFAAMQKRPVKSRIPSKP
jgi:hypothetical protein